MYGWSMLSEPKFLGCMGNQMYYPHTWRHAITPLWFTVKCKHRYVTQTLGQPCFKFCFSRAFFPGVFNLRKWPTFSWYHQWSPHEKTFKEWLQKFHTGDVSLLTLIQVVPPFGCALREICFNLSEALLYLDLFTVQVCTKEMVFQQKQFGKSRFHLLTDLSGKCPASQFWQMENTLRSNQAIHVY